MRREPIRNALRIWLGAFVIASAHGCASSAGPSSQDDGILNGKPAVGYPEAGYLNIDVTGGRGTACSAALIAPRVVLTAAHCIAGHKRWDVYVGDAVRSSTKSAVFDWESDGTDMVNPTYHDVGLVFLEQPIQLNRYPTLATEELPEGTRVFNVGRISKGTVTNTLYGAESIVSDGARIGHPFAYASTVVIEHGDSGGPDFLLGTHQIVAVNSGANDTIAVLARVDLVVDWIHQEIAAHGGPGPSWPVDAGASTPDAPTDTVAGPTDTPDAARPAADGRLPDSATSVVDAKPDGASPGIDRDTAGSNTPDTDRGSELGPSTPGIDGSGPDNGPGADAVVDSAPTAPIDVGVDPACPPDGEREPNDRPADACTLATGRTARGRLHSGDEDWVMLPTLLGPVRLELTAEGDATFAIGTWTTEGCAIGLSALRAIQWTSLFPLNGCLRISSASSAPQSYSLTRN